MRTHIVHDKKSENKDTLNEENSSAEFTNEQLQILNTEHELHISGKTKSYTWEQAKEIIRGKNAV